MTSLLTIPLLGVQAATRDSFLRMIDRPLVPLAGEMTAQEPVAGLGKFHFTYATEAGQRVPGLMFLPARGVEKVAGKVPGKVPVVIVLHGTGGTKEGQTGLLKKLAEQGFAAMAIDGRYHGERTARGTGSTEYQEAMLRTWNTGKEHPFLYDTVWDVMRLVDYIGTLPGLDANRIGLMGISKGGMETYLAAAVDPRIRVAVPLIGVQSFRWAIENDSWQSRAGTFQMALNGAAKSEGVANPGAEFLKRFYDRVAPGVYSEFDGPAMVPLIAPRPLLAINGELDPRTPMPGLQLCVEAARKAYTGAPEHFQLLIEEKTGHAVTPAGQAAAIAWFQKWL